MKIKQHPRLVLGTGRRQWRLDEKSGNTQTPLLAMISAAHDRQGPIWTFVEMMTCNTSRRPHSFQYDRRFSMYRQYPRALPGKVDDKQ
jgi:hypothetical protein